MATLAETVLNVDDNEAGRYVRSRILERAGFEVREAASGAEALSIASAWRPQLIVLDVGLPDIDGMEVCRRIKTDPATALIPVLHVSAIFRLPELQAAGLEAGADAYLTEPVEPLVLVATARALLRMRHTTEELQREIARRTRAEQMLEAAIETVPALVALTDSEGRLLLFNRAAEELTGYSRYEVLGRSLPETFVPPDWIPVVRKRFADPDETRLRRPHENPWITKSGEARIIEWRCTPVRLPGYENPCILGAGIDVTGRKREQRYRATQLAITRALADAVNLADAVGQVLRAICRLTSWQLGAVWWVEANRNSLRWGGMWHVHGISVAEFDEASRDLTLRRGEGLPGRVWLTGKPAWVQDVTRDSGFLRAAAAAKAGLRGAFAFPIMQGNETVGVLEFFTPEVRQADPGLLKLMSGAGVQIGQFVARKREEERLFESEARFRRLFEADIIGIIHADPERITEANDVFLNMIGYTRQELLAGELRWRDMTPPEYERLDQRALAELTATGRATPYEKEFIRKDGSRVPILIGASLLAGDGNPEWICFVLDLTERKRLQERLLQAQKTESVGTLAGGMAHNINNLLVGITGGVSLALEDLPQRDRNRPLLAGALESAERAAALTAQLLAYSGRGRTFTRDVDLSMLVADSEPVLRGSLSARIRLEFDLASGLPSLDCDPAQVQQVLTNLVLNAAEAIGPGSGTVRIATRLESLDEDGLRALWSGDPIGPGHYLVLEVSDTGPGMDEETKTRIFDPFFTTKFTGRGLGLAAVDGIARSYRGGVQVLSSPGQGSSFQVFLPAEKAFRREGNRSRVAGG